MTRTTLALLLGLAAAAARAQGVAVPPDARPLGAPPGAGAVRGTTLPRGAVLEEVSGVVREVDRTAHRISVEASGAPVELSLDRNTMVYTPAGLGTVLDVVPGAQIRAGRNAEFLAYWIQVGPPAAKKDGTPTTPGQGTGPAGGAAAGATETGAPGASPPTPPGTAGPGPGAGAGVLPAQ
jgi:hypothetical protein